MEGVALTLDDNRSCALLDRDGNNSHGLGDGQSEHGCTERELHCCVALGSYVLCSWIKKVKKKEGRVARRERRRKSGGGEKIREERRKNGRRVEEGKKNDSWGGENGAFHFLFKRIEQIKTEGRGGTGANRVIDQ